MTTEPATPGQHPQTRAFLTAGERLREQRYWDHASTESEIEFLGALAVVLREVSYQLDRHKVLDPVAAEAFRQAAPFHIPSFVDTNAEAILMGSLEHRIQTLGEQDRANS
ncbi:MAG: hypothetical protein HOQ07_06655 [Sinomonas sp.]|nr:hypothetical protein [Sinomonas sp.]